MKLVNINLCVDINEEITENNCSCTDCSCHQSGGCGCSN